VFVCVYVWLWNTCVYVYMCEYIPLFACVSLCMGGAEFLMSDSWFLFDSVCCSVLQCVAVRCSALQCVAMCCSVLRCVAVCCSLLKSVAVCCSLLQSVAVCCSLLQCHLNSRFLRDSVCSGVLQCIAVRCSTMQHAIHYKTIHHTAHTATRCTTLQLFFRRNDLQTYATRCNTLQHTATIFQTEWPSHSFDSGTSHSQLNLQKRLRIRKRDLEFAKET